MGVHRVEVAHHIDVSLQSAVSSDSACIVGTGSELMFGTQYAEGSDGCEHLLGGSGTQHLVAIVVPHGDIIGEVEHADTHIIGGTIGLIGKSVKACADLLSPRLDVLLHSLIVSGSNDDGVGSDRRWEVADWHHGDRQRILRLG